MTIFAITSCTPYLDVVPDNTRTIEDIFTVKQEAYNALAKIYSYLPPIHETHSTPFALGDEYIGRLDLDINSGNLRAIRIMRGLQNTNSPILGDWSGTSNGRKLYEAIRQCNIFLKFIDRVSDMNEEEKREWAAQATFLKAYYNFLLIQKYGPIVIVDDVISPDAMADELFMVRAKVEDCFNYVIDLMNKAIPNIKESVKGADLGQIDRIGATAIKARVLLFRASPFFNGNRDYYEDFLDHDKKPFFPLEYNREKWKDVIDACNEALALCAANGKDLFTYERDIFYGKDKEDVLINEDAIKKLYDLRMLVVSPWNKELLWGLSKINIDNDGGIAQACNIRLPADFKAESGGDSETTAWSWQWFCASYAVAERYYTKNGLPIDEDLTFDRNKIQNLVYIPPVEDPEYQQYAGIMQPGAETIYLYMNREPRFYANLGITGGYWRGHLIRIPTIIYRNKYAGMNATSNTDYFCTGIGIQKFVHPESTSGTYRRQARYPYPIIRMADLYLMKAEALNEYSGPSQEVYDALNKIRRRAGIPEVEMSWGDMGSARNPNKHKDQAGLRDIILYERGVEFAFEGSRFWDMWRHKRAPREFSSPIWGWNPFGYDAQEFFVLEVKHSRKFTITDCLWPISINEMNTNANLIQNPGWK